MELGYILSSEEHGPNQLVRYARRAEEAGFSFAAISDHFHPWVDAQGNSPFVWSVLGGVAQATSRMQVGTAVTCPTFRIHPAIVAQAAATAALMFEGRFFLGLGSGENLNEHVVGASWPSPVERLERLEEAIDIMRELWTGEYVDHYGAYYTVESARIYTLPDEPPPIIIAATGPMSTRIAAEAGDGVMTSSSDKHVIDKFNEMTNGSGRPTYGRLAVCWAPSEEEGIRLATKVWPNGGIPGALNSELKTPAHYGAAAQLVTEQEIAKSFVAGPDPEAYLSAIEDYRQMGYNHVILHNVGPDQERFFQFFERELRPAVAQPAGS